jgi:hypothetical protein
MLTLDPDDPYRDEGDEVELDVYDLPRARTSR